MYFEDREQAAELLARQLASFQNSHPVVAALPRGAVPMADLIAERLGGDLDVMLVRKLRARESRELAIGSVGESGHIYMHPDASRLNSSRDYIQQEVNRELGLIRQRREKYSHFKLPQDLHGRTVILVDDGIATGATMLSAIHEARSGGAMKVIVAAAVAPRKTLALLRKFADQVFVLDSPKEFFSVGQFFRDFHQVEDSEVQKILERARLREIQTGQPHH